MPINEFKRNLAVKGYGPGARWLKADFHVHLPTGHDYEYKEGDAFEQLGRAMVDTGLSFAIVLKHETFATKAELEKLQKHCPSVKLIPGVEINVIVDALFKKIGKDYFFHCIVAVDPDDEDEYGYVLRAARDKFQYREGDYPAGFRSSIVDVARHFRDAGALFIPAHLHQGKAPETSRSVDDLYDDDAFLGFVSDGVFDAIEVREIATAKFFDGKHTTTDGRTIPHISCVRSSDAHHHEAFAARQRATWIRAENNTFGELRAALALSHRVMLEPLPSNHAQVVGIHVVGSFVPDTWISLNDGLNALIGSKGSGKTALLECLRFVLNTPIPKERSDEVRKHREHILGTGGYVECLVRDTDLNHRLIVRRTDSIDRIAITSETGETSTVTAASGQVFPISILGWHEIESVADHASARVGILDRAGRPEEIIQAYARITDTITLARDALPLLQRQVRSLDRILKELWELRRKRATLSRLSEGQLSQLQDQYDWFLKAEERLNAIATNTATRRSQIPELIPSRLDTSISSPPEKMLSTGLEEALHRLDEGSNAVRKVESESTGAIDNALAILGAEAQNSKMLLDVAFQTFRETVYAPAVEKLSPEEREILTKQIQVLEETKRLPSVEGDCVEKVRELHSQAANLEKLCNTICTLRDQIAESRLTLVNALNKELPGVQLEFRRSANREARDRFQGCYPADGAGFFGFVDKYSGSDAYEKLREMFATLQSLDIDQDKWNVQEQLTDAKLVDLLDVIDDDDIGISLSVGRRGFVPIQSLSAGQRCVAVFPLLLRNSRGPLVIDQPEDNLDNRYIADNIGPDLLMKKREQQYLVTSHNANLVVLTDADLIVHVDSDGTKAEFPTAGFLAWEQSPIKEAVLGVLDGGEAALLARQKKYGIGRPI